MSDQKRCHQYSNKYVKYGVIPSVNNDHLPQCLICEKTFRIKPSRISQNLNTKHLNEAKKDIIYFLDLKHKFKNLSTLLKNIYQRGNQLHSISKLIAKYGKHYNIGETLIILFF